MGTRSLAHRFERDGFISPVRFISTDVALAHRQRFENAEREIGNLHYQAKVHTVVRSAYELACHRDVLDIVETLLCKDILVYNVEYIVKEPHSAAYVSWHQDLTYWGLSSDDQVSMWLALSPANETSGGMCMVPGSHVNGRLEHRNTNDPTNLLFQGQTVTQVEEGKAVMCSLEPGEASFHHGWTLHASGPNNSDDRRIGLNVQYIKPSVRQLKHQQDSALLVRGTDAYQHFLVDVPASKEVDIAALTKFKALNRVHREIAADATIAKT